LTSDETIKKLHVSFPRYDISRGFKLGVMWPLFLRNYLQTVHVPALSHVLCA